jgi:hypothetical protein
MPKNLSERSASIYDIQTKYKGSHSQGRAI